MGGIQADGMSKRVALLSPRPFELSLRHVNSCDPLRPFDGDLGLGEREEACQQTPIVVERERERAATGKDSIADREEWRGVGRDGESLPWGKRGTD